MNLEVVNEEKNFLELSFEGDAHTLLNLLKKKLLEDSDVEFAGYNKPHPLINKSTLIVRTKKGDPKKVLKNSINEAIKDLKSLIIK
ncbi:MAG: DNA-directed RNA polymerase subunit L [Nanoarchaeota archaeon]|nr:DNA-directed RNA polymerase subunit L [Nanoarchaeota archaeon]